MSTVITLFPALKSSLHFLYLNVIKIPSWQFLTLILTSNKFATIDLIFLFTLYKCYILSKSRNWYINRRTSIFKSFICYVYQFIDNLLILILIKMMIL